MEKINRRVLFVGLARDCEKNLKNVISSIEDVRSELLYSEVFVVENDSKDSTKIILSSWESSNKGVTIDSVDYGTLTIPVSKAAGDDVLRSRSRITKLVEYRNKYIDFLQGKKFDVLVIVDFDIEFIEKRGLIASIEKIDSEIGGIFSYGYTYSRIGTWEHLIYYDTYAFRDSNYSFNLSQKESNVLKKFINKQKRQGYSLEVISAFGGLAVYNFNAISNLVYKCEFDDNGNAICEHVSINSELIGLGFKNYLSFSQKVIYGRHSFGAIIDYFYPSFYKFLRFILYRN